MKEFHDLDLAEDLQKLDSFPDGFFDVAILSHVIEHLPNGTDVLSRVADKVKAGGRLYVEFPSVRSLKLPSFSAGVLHFCDDPTHVRRYEIQ